jgi:hypothetical protein
VLLMPRWIEAQRVTFKYGLGSEFIRVLRTLHKLGLDKTDPVRVGGASVSPRDVVADGAPREVYLYHVVDNAWSMAEYDCHAGAWSGSGVLGPEALARSRCLTCSPSTVRRGPARNARPRAADLLAARLAKIAACLLTPRLPGSFPSPPTPTTSTSARPGRSRAGRKPGSRSSTAS